MDKDLNIFENLEPEEDLVEEEVWEYGYPKLPEVEYTGVAVEDVNWNEKGNYKVGDIVEIIDNELGHGFTIGEHVRILSLDEHGFVYFARSIHGGQHWAIYDTEIKRIKK